MIESLDEAIKHCEEVANRERELYRMCPEDCNGSSDCRELKHGKDKGCLKCAQEHEQLSEWLKELKSYREGTRTCEFCKHEDKADTDFPCSLCRCSYPNKFETKEGE